MRNRLLTIAQYAIVECDAMILDFAPITVCNQLRREGHLQAF